MNISTPIPANIGGVEFGFYSREDVRALSVKRIVHTESISPELGHPIPGGLYDQALGTRADYPCTTCSLGHFCPGHAGHIELPLPVYHPIFLDQLMKMLNSQCGACMKFRMGRVEAHRYASKLKLLRYGLINESHELDKIGKEKVHMRKAEAGDEGTGDESDGDSPDHVVIRKRNDYMKSVFKLGGGKKLMLAAAQQKIEALAEERRTLIKELMSSLSFYKKCENCKAMSSRFKKNGFNKIFKKSLTAKGKAHNSQYGLKEKEPLLERARVHQEAAAKKRKRRELESDEGISMEVDDLTDETEEEEPFDDTALSDGDLLDSAAVTSANRNVGDTNDESESQEYVLPTLVFARMEELFQEESELLGVIYHSRTDSGLSELSPYMFFLHDVIVTPNKYRPDMRTGAGAITEADQNTLYKSIINASNAFAEARRAIREAEHRTLAQDRAFASMNQAAITLQDAVNSLIDTDKNPMMTRGMAQAAEGVKQKLEKKEGLFRMNMMGKRVNFAARSVISPDPNIETNEIGVPPVFAKKLTYPEPVTNHNFYELKEAVLNGPDKWPGAAAIENENGQVINLKSKNFEERQALANQLLAPSNSNVSGARSKKVHRHLNNGDMVIMNRQPTLHKPSMMCHRARVLPGEKTIRMHYANCNTYNADFDGDEMNMHFPQNESARSEAVFIADTDHQYLSATAGKPLRGLIQDHLSMGVWLTNKDSLFDRGDYHQLLYACLRPEGGYITNENIITLPPAVVKPKPMWTGKQLISTVLKNIQPPNHPQGLTMTGKSQIQGERWVKGEENKKLTEGTVIFKNGELLCGILDKAQLGPAKGGFVHSIYETYGHTIAGKLLGILGRMLTKLEHMRAFSCGMEDIVFTSAGNKKRKELLKGAEALGRDVAAKYVSLEPDLKNKSLLTERLEEVLRDDTKQHGLDTLYNSRTADISSAITKSCLPSGLFKDFPKNQMQAMTTSGAKGSAVNANLISCNLGQQVLEGRRTPTMVSGKTLPSFKPFETAVRAGGYITNRFLTGVQPQEYYFHTMAGREGLIDTAVKTSRSGYLQRCIIKGMEGLQVSYDTSVRDADGTMVQFLYGEDGLDITKQSLLTNFKLQAENWKSLLATMNLGEAQTALRNEDAVEANDKAVKKFRKTGDLGVVDPIISQYNPSSTWGSVSEQFSESLKAYIKENPQQVIYDKKTNPEGEMRKKNFQMLMEMKYLRSIIDPGEPVGIVAGQSIGEPSTQMTLNTFHLAGHSAKNVTLGIPRLREIVMTASAKIATPQMELYLHSDIKEDIAKTFAKGITKLTLAEVVDNVTVEEKISKGSLYDQARIVNVRLDFFPAQEYQETYAISEEDVARSVELKFIPALAKAIKKEMKDKAAAQQGNSVAQPAIGKSVGASEGISAKDTAGGSNLNNGDPDDSATKETGRTDDPDSEESDPDDEPQEDRPEKQDAYDGDEDDNAIAAAAREGSAEPGDDQIQPHEDEGYGGSPRTQPVDDDSEDEVEEEGSDIVSSKRKVSKQNAADRAERLVSKDGSHVTDFKWDVKTGGSWCEISFEYDVNTAKILMLHLVESACHTAVVQSITGIDSATTDKRKVRDDATGQESEDLVVLTDGVNLLAMHDFQHIVDPDKIFTNDIVSMLNTYGVEAGRATIVREMDAVFKGHSIAVDNRHLNLIGDYMTRNGGFLAFSRTGMKSGVSPFAKMSFETTVGFLKDAALDGDFDDLKGPSARIVTGQAGKIGTGAFDVLTPVA